MLKNILSLGEVLNKKELKSINGGSSRQDCSVDSDCKKFGPCFECTLFGNCFHPNDSICVL